MEMYTKVFNLLELLFNVHFMSGQSGTSGLLTLFSVATDLYSKLQYNDVDCQKKIICEFMKDPDMFGESNFPLFSPINDVKQGFIQSNST